MVHPSMAKFLLKVWPKRFATYLWHCRPHRDHWLSWWCHLMITSNLCFKAQDVCVTGRRARATACQKMNMEPSLIMIDFFSARQLRSHWSSACDIVKHYISNRTLNVGRQLTVHLTTTSQPLCKIIGIHLWLSCSLLRYSLFIKDLAYIHGNG